MLPTPYVKNSDYDKVYEPAEDSFLLLDSLEAEVDKLSQRFNKQSNYVPIVVELGCGSGILSTFMMQNHIPKKNSLYFPVDVNPWALKVTNETILYNTRESTETPETIEYNLLQMDLTTGLRPKTVDILVFNPPYVPAENVPDIPENDDDNRKNNDDWLDLALLGGPEGMDITVKVLESLETMLSKDGVAYILFCARNKPENVVEEWSQKGWSIDLIERRKAGWEVLSVYKFTRS